jgi:hypothetical protein
MPPSAVVTRPAAPVSPTVKLERSPVRQCIANGLFDLQFATPALGAVVDGRPGLGTFTNRLLVSRDDGTTFSASRL